jgi:hypothetical protein
MNGIGWSRVLSRARWRRLLRTLARFGEKLRPGAGLGPWADRDERRRQPNAKNADGSGHS